MGGGRPESTSGVTSCGRAIDKEVKMEVSNETDRKANTRSRV